MRGIKPDRFLAGVLRDSSEPVLQAGAATALYGGGPSSADPLTQGVVNNFVRYSLKEALGNLSDTQSLYHSYMYRTYVSHLAVHGTPADLSGLSQRALEFTPRGLNAAPGEEIPREYQDAMNFAIDAIRLRANW